MSACAVCFGTGTTHCGMSVCRGDEGYACGTPCEACNATGNELRTAKSLVIKAPSGSYVDAQLFYDGKPLDLIVTRVEVSIAAGEMNHATLYVEGVEIEDLPVNDGRISVMQSALTAASPFGAIERDPQR